MNRSEQRETRALSSLHEISDYSIYIDQRISKLNNLYQSLNIQPTRKNHKHQTLFRKTPILAPSTPHKLFKTRNELVPSFDPMYRTDYVPKRYRYLQQKIVDRIDLKSLTISNFRNSLDISREKFSKMQEKPAKQKLQLYKKVKNEILGTFYVGGRTLSHHKGDIAAIDENNDDQPRYKKGRIWHGRPPKATEQ